MIKNIWPLNSPLSIGDRILIKIGWLPGYCDICGKLTLFNIVDPNVREHVHCLRCRSRNRQRQIIVMLISFIRNSTGNAKIASIKDIPKNVVIWNTETTGAIHNKLSSHLLNNYICSEFIDSSLSSGEMKNGILHVDIQKTHFEDNYFDYILSGDVMEHVPDPLKALEETYRILKPGGCHIFTVPFYQHRFSNEKRAILNDEGSLEYLRKPWYHSDPVHDNGALVYTIFTPELLVQLEKIGFDARLCMLHSAQHGILGNNGIVIAARKSIPPDKNTDWIFPNESI